jgi:uncharacterized membrane protein YraQ (UPF0718 family)
MAPRVKDSGAETPLGEFVRLFGGKNGISAKEIGFYALLGVLIFGIIQMFLRWGIDEIEQ